MKIIAQMFQKDSPPWMAFTDIEVSTQENWGFWVQYQDTEKDLRVHQGRWPPVHVLEVGLPGWSLIHPLT